VRVNEQSGRPRSTGASAATLAPATRTLADIFPDTIAECGDRPAPHTLGQQLTYEPSKAPGLLAERPRGVGTVGQPHWRATGLETPVFADPTGRRARTMSGIGVALLATTLAALVIVATAAIGFSTMPPTVQAMRSTGARVAASSVERRTGREFAVPAHVRSDRRERHRYVAARLVEPKQQTALDRAGN